MKSRNQVIIAVTAAAFVALIILVAFLMRSPEISNGEEDSKRELVCVPAQCCHPTSCVPADQAPDCSETFCTLECRPGTLDCGQGSCQAVEGKCEVKWEN